MILADVKELAGWGGDYRRPLYLGYHRPRPTLYPAKLERFSYSEGEYTNDLSENINIQILMYRHLEHSNINPDLPFDY